MAYHGILDLCPQMSTNCHWLAVRLWEGAFKACDSFTDVFIQIVTMNPRLEATAPESFCFTAVLQNPSLKLGITQSRFFPILILRYRDLAGSPGPSSGRTLGRKSSFEDCLGSIGLAFAFQALGVEMPLGDFPFASLPPVRTRDVHILEHHGAQGA